MNIENLSLTELKSLLSWIKEYKQVRKKLGKRWVSAFHKELSGEKDFVVEYSKWLTESDVYDKALEVYKKIFSETPKKEEISFIFLQKLTWGMRVYKDDFMVDLSFNNIEKKLRK